LEHEMHVVGDEGIGGYEPRVHRNTAERMPADDLARFRSLPGLTSTASDALDDARIPSGISASELTPRVPDGAVVGHAITLRYLPERQSRHASHEEARLAHLTAMATALPGDILVIDASGAEISTFGAMAGLAAREAGLGAVIVDGAIRDVNELRSIGLPIWSRSVTPLTGKWRLEAVEVNGPVHCGGRQVRPGDLVLADPTGVAFVPVERIGEVIPSVIDIATREMTRLQEEIGQA
jgi:4-hydroxy-4-methyl-2-oxoglutarate aldolase